MRQRAFGRAGRVDSIVVLVVCERVRRLEASELAEAAVLAILAVSCEMFRLAPVEQRGRFDGPDLGDGHGILSGEVVSS